MTNSFEIAVIGAGHAGCEAALCAARMGANTCLITPDSAAAGRMSCNPAIGGIGKSHIVVEIDALGGEMARNADYTGIQYRTLNMSKGPAVRAARIQCDRGAYSRRMSAIIRLQENLTVIEELATSIIFDGGLTSGVELSDGSRILASKVIVTAGTFLGGRVHIGDEIVRAGRLGEDPADLLSESLKRIGLSTVRLKTGTPARIRGRSIDYGQAEEQAGDVPPPFLSLQANHEWEMFHVEQSSMTPPLIDPELRPWALDMTQIPCFLTNTNEKAHDIVRANLGRSALYGGAISGTGVRYCPSFEDKIVKFPDRTSHHVFLEPEGRNTDLVYPNGISNSLPRDVQEEFLRAIPGLEAVEIDEWAYAIEYDAIDPTQLDHGLESREHPGLYLAGQVNGTTGYEEAAAQGFMAAANAALSLRGRAPMVLGRHEAYVGVMIDDLVTKGTDEPYRMFTSRAEYRLLLRPTNAFMRLAGQADELAINDSDTLALRDGLVHDVESAIAAGGGESSEPMVSGLAQREAEASMLYEGYVVRELERVERMLESESIPIPAGFDYEGMASLSTESRQKLSRVRPVNIGQAQRIPGVKPSDVAAIMICMKSRNA